MSYLQDQGAVSSTGPRQGVRSDQHLQPRIATSRVQYILLTLCIVSQLFFYPSWPIRPDRILCAFALARFVVIFLRGNTERPKIQTTEFLMIVYLTLLCASVISGDVMNRVDSEQSTMILQVLNISLFPFLFYFVAKHLTYSRKVIQNVSKCLVLVGIYLGLTAIFERFELNALIWPSYIMDPSFGIHWGRSRGPLGNSVFLGMTLVFCIMMMLTLWGEAKHAFQKYVLGSSILVCMVGVYLTNTRGCWIGMAIAMVTTLLFGGRARNMVIIAFAVAMFGFVTVGASKFSMSGETLFSKRQNTVVDREVNYAVALKMGFENPLFGIGWGRMGAEFDTYHRMIGSPEFGGWDGNHNEYLGIFAQVGGIALVTYGCILMSLIRMIVRVYQQLPRHLEFERGFTISALGCLFCYMTMALFSDIHSTPLINNLVYLFLGIVASMLSWSRNLLGPDAKSRQDSFHGKTPVGRLSGPPRHSYS